MTILKLDIRALGAQLLLALAVISYAAEAWSETAQNDSNQAVSVRESAAALEALLEKKFAEANYSRTGADQCMRCHDASSEHNAMGIFDNVHGRRDVPDSPFQSLQCEACHGPAGEHVKPRLADGESREPMISFGSHSLLSAEKQNSVCAGCHEEQMAQHWQGSVHERAGVACSSCHSVHTAEDPIRTRAEQTQVCGTCHQSQRMAGLQHGGHDMKNGAMVCSDCHQPHGSEHPHALKHASINDNCYSCHAEKRGPLLWEHEPVTEDCSTCHAPHGSVNPDMLVRRSPQLCQSCHGALGHASMPYTTMQTPFVKGESCTNCHAAVHGSNHPSGQRLQR